MADVRDVSTLQVRSTMSVVSEPTLCWVIRTNDGLLVEPVREFVAEMAANGTSPATRRSYCHDLLRWLRFCEAIETTWDRANTEDVRDFVRWLRAAPNSQRVRSGKESRPPAGSVNAATGKT